MMNGVIIISGLIFLTVLHLLLVMNGLNTFQNSRLSQLNQRFVTPDILCLCLSRPVVEILFSPAVA